LSGGLQPGSAEGLRAGAGQLESAVRRIFLWNPNWNPIALITARSQSLVPVSL
jgi:hypothetical protein